MKYLLILMTLHGGGLLQVNQVYPDDKSCQFAGEKAASALNTLGYVCLVKYNSDN